MLPLDWISGAAERIAPHIQRTPVSLDEKRNLYLKWENHQVTGSFKARGALNKVLALEAWEQQAGLVAASAGNHGQGVALAGKLVGASVTVFVPEQAVASKVQAIRSLGADVRSVPGGYPAAEAAGLRYARENQQTWISPYNDGLVVAGQGTVGLELAQDVQLDERVTVLVPVSGGGLISGVAVALTKLPHPPRVLGVQAERAPFMQSLFKRGTQAGISDLSSLADGLTGAVEDDSLTIPLVRQYVQDILLVDEDQIGQAVAFAQREYGETIEPSGVVGLAAILSGRVSGPAVVVISGGNIAPDRHAALLARYGGGK